MKKILAVLVSLMLVFSFAVTSFAADTKSGEMSPAFGDFDPNTITDMFAGLDLSAITGAVDGLDLSMITGLFEGMDADAVTNLLGDMDLSGLTDILGGLDIGALLGGVTGDNNGGAEDTTKAPETEKGSDAETTTKKPDSTTTTKPAETTTKKPAGTNNDKNNIAQTGDNGMISAFAVCAIAAGAFIVLSKKKEA